MRDEGAPRGALIAWLAFVVASAALVGLSDNSSYVVRAITAIAAASVLLRAARKGGPLARAQLLLAVAVLLGAASGVVAAVHYVAAGRTAGVGSVIDWIELSYIPVAAAGFLAIPMRPGGRLRMLADATVAAGSLWYGALVVVVEPRHLGDGLSAPGRLATIGFVIFPTFVVAVLLSVLPRAAAEAKSFLRLAAAGMVCLAVADASFSVATWQDRYQPTSWIGMLHQTGIVLVLCGALRSSHVRHIARPTLRREPLLEAVLPYAPLVVALGLILRQTIRHEGLTPSELVPCLVIGVAVVARHAASIRDHERLVDSLETRERDAREEALRDPLTGLDNRTAFVQKLGGQLIDAEAHPVAVALLDLNDFKDVNDQHGHHTGDELLRGCAERLLAAVPPGSCVARLGGDEFAVSTPRVADGGHGLARAIDLAFGDPIAVGLRQFAVHPSIGVVIDERGQGRATIDDAEQLLAHADVAMYQAKANKGREVAPAVVLAGIAREQAAGLIRLRDEVSRPDLHQFEVVYQPIVRLDAGTIAGFEALLRWRHPVLGEISPSLFIPLAEQVGSVALLGRHVLTTVAADLAGWPSAEAAGLSISVNLSPRELADADLPRAIVAVWQAHGLRPESLTLEITEGALMDDLDRAVERVAELRTAGVSVAVDDFGTGYSSLRYLRRLAANEVKIDKEFVQAMADEERTAALVRSVVGVATALDMHTVAEGIETADQLRAAREAGCELGQGRLFSEPVVASSAAFLVASGHSYPVRGPIGLAAVAPGPSAVEDSPEDAAGWADRQGVDGS
ncbi:MAG: EAL domain-containing protein [Acidobacteria bacterium]|nr:EAL domain-containing protein [Acidobacteriota bacterium]